MTFKYDLLFLRLVATDKPNEKPHYEVADTSILFESTHPVANGEHIKIARSEFPMAVMDWIPEVGTWRVLEIRHQMQMPSIKSFPELFLVPAPELKEKLFFGNS